MSSISVRVFWQASLQKPSALTPYPSKMNETHISTCSVAPGIGMIRCVSGSTGASMILTPGPNFTQDGSQDTESLPGPETLMRWASVRFCGVSLICFPSAAILVKRSSHWFSPDENGCRFKRNSYIFLWLWFRFCINARPSTERKEFKSLVIGK